ncbi:MAG: creatininase family protein, partial [Leisingera sp.]
MQLAHMTWLQVETCLCEGAAVMVPVGSTEQHGPMGMIGTDTICAEAVALRAAELCDAVVAPALAYTPAPFNTAFPG